MRKQLLTLLSLVFAASPVWAGDWATYQVTITNATTHQVLTPPVIVAHRQHFALFEVGSAASEALVTQAETGNPEPLHWEASNAQGVFMAVVGSEPIPYGQSAAFEIKAPKWARLSLTTMLATTNDGFAGLMGVPLPKRQGKAMALAYDAGSEVNNEDCAYVPGPPCDPNSGNARATEGAEGFISIHNGIQGGGDLNPKHLDWRGPVAVVSIQKIRD